MEFAPLESSNLAAHPVFKIVLVASGVSSDGAEFGAIRAILQDSDHAVQVVSLAPSPTRSTPAHATVTHLMDGAPDVMLVGTSNDEVSPADLVGRTKALVEPQDIPILALLPHHPGREPVGLEAWSALRDAGADDFIGEDASAAAILARIELMARYSRLQRDLAAAREQLSRNLQFDDLTQLLNRRFFFKAAHREWARSRRYKHRLACLMLEVNYLRLYNTTYGFACGDYVLRAVANIMRQWTRESDVVARFSEEKFVILLPETDVQGAVMLGENVLKVIGQTEFVWQGQQLPVTLSVGESERVTPGEAETALGDVASGEEDSESLSVREEVAELLADADAALVVAKKGARYPALCVDTTPGVPGRAAGDDEADVA